MFCPPSLVNFDFFTDVQLPPSRFFVVGRPDHKEILELFLSFWPPLTNSRSYVQEGLHCGGSLSRLGDARGSLPMDFSSLSRALAGNFSGIGG